MVLVNLIWNAYATGNGSKIVCCFFPVFMLFSSSAHAVQSAVEIPPVVRFNEHIRPIMSKTCFVCHGPDDSANESGLRLDTFESAIDEAAAILPGSPDDSLLLERINDADDPMPPAEFRHQLSDSEKAIFRKWIEQGAKYETHWSYAPVAQSEIPELDHFQDIVESPVDAFVLSKLEALGLKPSDVADKRTLLRRLSLDLIGLPPTIQQVEKFLDDESADAYETQVDRLLASQQYGERMASRWLDIIRFSDTVGFHGDQNQRIFPYRDYVIDSLNNNQPFDEFTREQLAGDLLDSPDEQQLVATGLLRLNMMTREGGAQPKEYLAKYAADRVRMIGTAWLGSTMGCCECHDHKYDPFSIKDFYSMAAFFDDVKQWGVYQNYGYTPNPDLRGFTNDHPFPPEMRINSPTLRRQIEFLEHQLDQAAASQLEIDESNHEAFQSWLSELIDSYKRDSSFWEILKPTSVSLAQEEPFEELVDGSLLFAGEPRSKQQLTIVNKVDAPKWISSIKMQVLPDASNAGHVGRSNGKFSTSVSLIHFQNGGHSERKIEVEPRNKLPEPSVEVEIPSQVGALSLAKPVAIAFAQADRYQPDRFSNGKPNVFLGKQWRSGPARWQLPYNESKLTHNAVFHLESPIRVNKDDKLVLRLGSTDLGRVKFLTSSVSRPVVAESAGNQRLASSIKHLSENNDLTSLPQHQQQAILSAYYRATVPVAKQHNSVKGLRNDIAGCYSGYTMTMVTQAVQDDKRRVSKVLPRGDWKDESGEVVDPAIPHFLPPIGNDENRRLSRLDLANWITSSSNPLTARHYVNRTWQNFFGNGLSNVLDDLGNQGEWPSHPQLLDWLASEFRSDWDRKRLVKLIVMSRTYRQHAACRPELKDRDPHNRLLTQQSARRLEAEAVRDNALAISGLLKNDWVGGRSVFPFQPPGYYSNLQFPNRKYGTEANGLQYRRGVYMHWQRTFLHPMLTNFDAPSRDECTAYRTESNSPQQALTLLNDPVFVEAARAFADRILANQDDFEPGSAINYGFLLALSREPTDAERNALQQLFRTQREYFENNLEEAKSFNHIGQFAMINSKDEVELAALSQVCRVILNLHEVITRY